MRTAFHGRHPGRPMLCPDHVLRRILTMHHGEGRKARSICDELNGEGIPTPAGKQRWERNHVHRLLRTRRANELMTELGLRGSANERVEIPTRSYPLAFPRT